METFSEIERVEIGRELGYDLYRYSRVGFGLEWAPPIREGFVQAQSRDVVRQTPDRFVKKWLQLRFGAFRRQRIIDSEVKPELLRKIDVEQCPVTRIALTHGVQKSTDWSVDRLNNEGAYAPHNLAVMSTGANIAKGDFSYDEIYALSLEQSEFRGLNPEEWLRLAVLMLGPCHVERPSLSPILPLVAPIPQYTVRSAVQLIQYIFTTSIRTAAEKNQLIRQFRQCCDHQHAVDHLQAFAEGTHEGIKRLPYPWDVWLQPGVMRKFMNWKSSLTPEGLAIGGQIAMCLIGARPVPKARLRRWHMDSGGYFIRR